VLTLLDRILCAVTNVAWWIADLVVMLINTLIGALAAVAFAALGLLPDLPELPADAPPAVLGYANWAFPISGLFAIFGGYLTLYVTARLYMAAVRLMDRLGIVDSGR
jgi:hypothetical protein